MLRSSVVWRLVLVYFFIQVGFYGLNLWLPDASGGSFLSTALVLAVALMLGGLVMLTLRRQADKPVHVAQPGAAAGAHWSRASRSR